VFDGFLSSMPPEEWILRITTTIRGRVDCSEKMPLSAVLENRIISGPCHTKISAAATLAGYFPA
jgi:hypothetical protein